MAGTYVRTQLFGDNLESDECASINCYEVKFKEN